MNFPSKKVRATPRSACYRRHWNWERCPHGTRCAPTCYSIQQLERVRKKKRRKLRCVFIIFVDADDWPFSKHIMFLCLLLSVERGTCYAVSGTSNVFCQLYRLIAQLVWSTSSLNDTSSVISLPMWYAETSICRSKLSGSFSFRLVRWFGTHKVCVWVALVFFFLDQF